VGSGWKSTGGSLFNDVPGRESEGWASAGRQGMESDAGLIFQRAEFQIGARRIPPYFFNLTYTSPPQPANPKIAKGHFKSGRGNLSANPHFRSIRVL